MNVSKTLSDAWDLYRRFFVRFVITAGVVYVVLDFLGAVVATASDDGAGIAFWILVDVLVTIVGFFWVQGALAEAVRDVRDGRIDVSVSDLYARTRPRLPALISAGVLAGIGIAVGFVLLIVPGLYLVTRWALIIPVIVLEGRSAGESFTRSWELVKGYGWSVLGLVVLAFLGMVIAGNVIVAIFAWLPEFLAAWLGALAAHALTVPFFAAALTLAYYRLVELEGASAEQSAAAPA